MLLYFHPQCLLDRGRINTILHINSTEAILQEIFFLKLQMFLLGFFFQCTCDTHLCNSKSKLGINKVTVIMVQSCQKNLCFENSFWYIALNCTTLYYSEVQYSSQFGGVKNDFFPDSCSKRCPWPHLYITWQIVYYIHMIYDNFSVSAADTSPPR